MDWAVISIRRITPSLLKMTLPEANHYGREGRE
jgi:hypothetical protein